MWSKNLLAFWAEILTELVSFSIIYYKKFETVKTQNMSWYHIWQRGPNPPYFMKIPHIAYPSFQILCNSSPLSLLLPTPTLTALSVVLFPWLDVWSCHIWCTTLLTRANSRLIAFNYRTLPPFAKIMQCFILMQNT